MQPVRVGVIGIGNMGWHHARVLSLLRDAEAAGVKLNYGHETAAELLWMGLHGLVAALINNPDFPWSNRDELIEGMLDVVTKGVLAD